jgi:hypothetical protein
MEITFSVTPDLVFLLIDLWAAVVSYWPVGFVHAASLPQNAIHGFS